MLKKNTMTETNIWDYSKFGIIIVIVYLIYSNYIQVQIDIWVEYEITNIDQILMWI